MGTAPPDVDLSRLEQTKRFGTDPIGFIRACAREYGPVFRTNVLGDGERVWVGHPDVVKAVFALKSDQFTVTNTVPVNIGERSLLYQDGAAHSHQRKVLTPPFTKARMKGYGEAMLRHAEQRLATLRGEVDLQHALDEVTLAVILDCVFGLEDEAEQAELLRITPAWTDAVLTPMAFTLSMIVGGMKLRRAFDWMADHSPLREGRARGPLKPPAWWRDIADPKAALDRVLLQAIEEGRASGVTGRKDVLALLLASTFEDGSPLDDELIHHQLLTVLVGGHETTSNTVAWTFHHLLEHPDVVQALRAEQREAFGDGPLDPARLSQLPLLGSVIAESMRLSSIAIGVGRCSLVPIEAGGYSIPAGSHVSPSPYVLHFNPELWPEPERFVADRFVGRGRIPSHQFMPYGGGRRICLGMVFAELEVRVLVSVLVRHLDLEPRRTDDGATMKGLTLIPSDGVPVVARERVTAPAPDLVAG